MFSAAQYANWCVVVAASVIMVGRLWRAHGFARLVWIYVLAQPLYAAALIPVSFLGSRSAFYASFIGVSLVDYTLQLACLISVGKTLKNGTRGFGRLRYWALAVLIVTTFVSANSLIAAPPGYTRFEALWNQSAQVMGIARTAALIAVALYGWSIASSWQKPVLLAWSGLALQCVTDFLASRADLLGQGALHTTLQYLTTFGFLAALGLWWFIPDHPAVVATPSFPRRSTEECA